MEKLCVAAHHFLEPGAPGLAPQLETEHVQIDVELRLHVGEEERLAEGVMSSSLITILCRYLFLVTLASSTSRFFSDTSSYLMHFTPEINNL